MSAVPSAMGYESLTLSVHAPDSDSEAGRIRAPEAVREHEESRCAIASPEGNGGGDDKN